DGPVPHLLIETRYSVVIGGSLVIRPRRPTGYCGIAVTNSGVAGESLRTKPPAPGPIMSFCRHLLTLLALAPIVRGGGAAEPKHGEFASETVKVNGTTREYRLVVPKDVDLTKPAPLVVAFHGMLIDSKDLMPAYTKLNETAAKHKFLIAYPNALDRAWG